jgi:hypothetical protein
VILQESINLFVITSLSKTTCCEILGTGLYVHNRIISAVKRVEFVSDRMSYIILRGRWCDIIVLNVHAPTEDKIDDMQDRFYEDLEYVFDKIPKYHMKILLGNFPAKVGREDIFKPTTRNDSLRAISSDNGVRVVNLVTSKILTVKVQCSHIVTFINLLGRILMEKLTIKFTIF